MLHVKTGKKRDPKKKKWGRERGHTLATKTKVLREKRRTLSWQKKEGGGVKRSGTKEGNTKR